jgi:phosphonate metabolism protein PhnN/1,5-bisphosphokinase (PRPP-forming)
MVGGSGHLVLVVGPSGAGKDSVLSGAKEVLKGDSRYVFPRRFVTRLSNPNAEDHVSLSEAEFEFALAEGAFSLWWRAHGNNYGIGRIIENYLESGSVVIVNCSRASIAEARARFSNITVAEVTAPEDVLVSRIMARGRETAEQARERVSRRVPDYPAGVRVVRILNDGPIESAVTAFCELLQNAVSNPCGGSFNGQNQQENCNDNGRGLIVVEHFQ